MQLNQILEYNVMNMPWPLESNSIDCCVTSPPYWGLRDYGVPGQIGLEPTPEEFIRKLVVVFDEVRRCLKPTGTLWLNIGDSYAHNGAAYGNEKSTLTGRKHGDEMGQAKRFVKKGSKLKPKDLVGIPWMLAFALRDAGWYLRSDIVWAKTNCMPESVADRPTRSHEFIFLLSKSGKYHYDHIAIKEPALYDVDGTGTASRKARQKEGNKTMPGELKNGIRPAGFKNAGRMHGKNSDKQADTAQAIPNNHDRNYDGFNDRWEESDKTGMRNKRDVWTVSPAQFPEAHFATFPEQLITPCILAGCPKDGIVFDPFMGAGTTGLVALSHGRKFIGLELNPKYITLANKRLKQKFGMFYEGK